MREPLIIRKDPLISISGESLHHFPQAQVESVAFGVGTMAVNLDACDLSPQSRRATFLASIGLPNQEIANMLRVSESHVKHGLVAGSFEALGLPSRGGLPRCFFDLEVYTATKSAQPLDLQSSEEAAIVELASHGFSNKQIGKQRNRAEATIKSHLYKIFGRNYIQGRVELGLAGILSGQIGDYPVQETAENK